MLTWLNIMLNVLIFWILIRTLPYCSESVVRLKFEGESLSQSLSNFKGRQLLAVHFPFLAQSNAATVIIFTVLHVLI